MKPTNNQVTAFLKAPNPAARVVLIYGPDAGLVKERAQEIAKKTVAQIDDPFCVARLPADSLSDPASLYDEMASQSLVGGRRLVWIPGAPDSLSGAVSKLLADLPPSDSLLLIEAGDLDRKSKLRAAVENGPDSAFPIPCYLDDAGARARQIIDQLKEGGLTIPRDVLMELAPLLPPDRGAMRSEIEKLSLYAHGKEAVSMDDVRAIIEDAAAAAGDDLVMATASGDVKRIGPLLDHLWEEQTSAVALLRAAQRHFMRLQQARAHYDKGLSAAEAVGKLQPKVFWKMTEPMARQVSIWPVTTLGSVLERFYETEAAVKRTGTPDQVVCGQLFLRTAMLVAGRR